MKLHMLCKLCELRILCIFLYYVIFMCVKYTCIILTYCMFIYKYVYGQCVCLKLACWVNFNKSNYVDFQTFPKNRDNCATCLSPSFNSRLMLAILFHLTLHPHPSLCVLKHFFLSYQWSRTFCLISSYHGPQAVHHASSMIPNWALCWSRRQVHSLLLGCHDNAKCYPRFLVFPDGTSGKESSS